MMAIQKIKNKIKDLEAGMYRLHLENSITIFRSLECLNLKYKRII